MARRRWVERDHPRHPGGSGEQSGRFREKVGGAGWAMRLAGRLGKGRSRDVPPWEGGAPDDDDVFLRDWESRVNVILRERGIDPDEMIGPDIDFADDYGQYQADPAEYADFLMEQHRLPGGRGDLADTSAEDLRDALEVPAHQARRRLTGQEVADALAPHSERADASTLWAANQPAPSRERDADPGHDNYNEHIIEEAIGAQEVNAESGDADAELDAQIELVQELRRRNRFSQWDEAVDHLRRMLTISYLDEDDLPPLPPGRRSGTSGV